MAARAKKRANTPTLALPQMPLQKLLLWLGLFSVLLAVIVATGLRVVHSADSMRVVYQQLGATQQQQDELLAEYSRLLLERAALSSLQNIEQVAESELNMEFPEQVGQVLR